MLNVKTLKQTTEAINNVKHEFEDYFFNIGFCI